MCGGVGRGVTHSQGYLEDWPTVLEQQTGTHLLVEAFKVREVEL